MLFYYGPFYVSEIKIWWWCFILYCWRVSTNVSISVCFNLLAAELLCCYYHYRFDLDKLRITLIIHIIHQWRFWSVHMKPSCGVNVKLQRLLASFANRVLTLWVWLCEANYKDDLTLFYWFWNLLIEIAELSRFLFPPALCVTLYEILMEHKTSKHIKLLESISSCH